MSENDFTIRIADPGTPAYEGLRSLWHETFGDPPEYVDAFYGCFGSDIKGFAVTDSRGRVCSALSCYVCGSFEERPVYVSYAICTAEELRGRGLAGMLTGHVRDTVLSRGGISIVSPAERSLEAFYERLGYEPFFYASEQAAAADGDEDGGFEDGDGFEGDAGHGKRPAPDIYELGGGELEPFVPSANADFEAFVPAANADFEAFVPAADADFEAFVPAADMEPLSPAAYNSYRETFLAGRPHITLNEDMLMLAAMESLDGCGLYAINRGDAICTVSEADASAVTIKELIASPVLLGLSSDIESELAAMVARHFGSAEAVYRSPGGGRCQSMAAGLPERSGEEYIFEEAYYGFPID